MSLHWQAALILNCTLPGVPRSRARSDTDLLLLIALRSYISKASIDFMSQTCTPSNY